MSALLECTVVRPWFHTTAAVADRRKELSFSPQDLSGTAICGSERGCFFHGSSAVWLYWRHSLNGQDLRAGWLCCPFILSALQEFLWKLCNIQLPLPHFPHALRNSKGKWVPWDPDSTPDGTRC